MNSDFLHRDMERYALAFQEGNNTGINFLFAKWYASLCAYTRSLIKDETASEEIASEAFMKTWNYRYQFRSSGEIKAYLFTVAKHDAFRWQQQHKKHQLLPVAQLASMHEPDHSCQIVKTEIRQLLYEAIDTLPPRCRQIFQLLYIHGKSTEETARALGISPYTVRAQKARGIGLLKPKLHTFFSR